VFLLHRRWRKKRIGTQTINHGGGRKKYKWRPQKNAMQKIYKMLKMEKTQEIFVLILNAKISSIHKSKTHGCAPLLTDQNRRTQPCRLTPEVSVCFRVFPFFSRKV